jgi:hypothetical protein
MRGFPLLVVEAKPPDVPAEVGYREASLYVKELRERTRRIIESPDGIEKPATDCTAFAHLPEIKGKVQ